MSPGEADDSVTEPPTPAMDLRWVDDDTNHVDWQELSNLYRIAPLGDKPPEAIATTFDNSRYTVFAYRNDQLVGAGRALADGVDCAYLADVAVHPDEQGRGLGAMIINRLVAAAEGHKKIILYANPGTESFYQRLGFLPMNTAMAIWQDPAAGVASGVLRPPDEPAAPEG